MESGLVQAGAITLLPDSIRPGNKAGFYWDYSPPKGTDTVRVFSSTELETAQMIRQRVKGLQAAVTETSGKVGTRSVTAVIESIREYLSRAATCGTVAVYDPTSHIPGPADAGQPGSGKTTQSFAINRAHTTGRTLLDCQMEFQHVHRFSIKQWHPLFEGVREIDFRLQRNLNSAQHA